MVRLGQNMTGKSGSSGEGPVTRFIPSSFEGMPSRQLCFDLLQADTSVSGRRPLFCSDDRTVQLSNMVFGCACF